MGVHLLQLDTGKNAQYLSYIIGGPLAWVKLDGPYVHMYFRNKHEGNYETLQLFNRTGVNNRLQRLYGKTFVNVQLAISAITRCANIASNAFITEETL